MKAKSLRSFLYFENLKARRLKAHPEGIGIGRYECVADMDQSHAQAQQTVASEERCARLQDSPHFTEQAVLERPGRHVVQHGKADCPRKSAIRERHRARISRDDLHVAVPDANEAHWPISDRFRWP